MEAPKKYHMSINLNVLNHLGINLYSNIPAVLSEVVANSWDADATNVDIEIDTEKITITDDGHGMTYDDINSKYLEIGYERRTHQAVKTKEFDRDVMGRKGIGKLSLFSIAKIVKVETFKDGSQNGFVMSTDEIEKHIKEKKHEPYEPKPMPESEMVLNSTGTRIILTELKRRVSIVHSDYVKKRLARRFSIIGDDKFTVRVDGSPISITDRDYFHKIQFLWYYGDESEKYINFCDNLENDENTEKRDGTIEVRDEDNIENVTGSVTGWIGTVRKPRELTDTNVDGEKDVNENLNKIVIMVRGKLAQENILDDFRQSGFYTKYLIGEIHADFLDIDNLDDIATTSRQEIIKDNPRYEELKAWLKNELFHIRDKWDEWRSEIVRKEVYQIPAIKAWLNELKPAERKQAESLFSKIGEVHLDNDENRKQLYIHTALGFENLLYKGALDQLEQISLENIPAFMEILGNIDDIEISLYYRMIQKRLEIVSKFQEMTDEDVVEKIVQECLYDHLWLLDPSWDRATESPLIEQNVKKEFEHLDIKFDPKKNMGRFDIKYRKSSGKHIIIELKRSGRTLDEHDLTAQVLNYRDALEELVALTGKDEPVEVVCIVGKPLKQWTTPEKEEESKKSMAARNIRVIYYQELIENAYRSYKDFLDKNQEAGRVFRLIKNLEIETPEAD